MSDMGDYLVDRINEDGSRTKIALSPTQEKAIKKLLDERGIVL